MKQLRDEARLKTSFMGVPEGTACWVVKRREYGVTIPLNCIAIYFSKDIIEKYGLSSIPVYNKYHYFLIDPAEVIRSSGILDSI